VALVTKKLRSLGRTLQVQCILWPWNSYCVQGRGLVLHRTVLSLSWEDQMDLTPFLYVWSAQLLLSAHTGAAVYKPCKLMIRYNRSVDFIAWGRWMCVNVLFCGSAFTFFVFLVLIFSFLFYFLFSFNWKGSAWDPPKSNNISGVTFKSLCQAEVIRQV